LGGAATGRRPCPLLQSRDGRSSPASGYYMGRTPSWTSGRHDEESAMTLMPVFTPGADIPAQHTGDGSDMSPALSWTAPPEGTQSFALILDDPDAPRGTWVHWVLYNLPQTERGLPQVFRLTARSLPVRGRDGTIWTNRLRRPVPTARAGTSLLFQAVCARQEARVATGIDTSTSGSLDARSYPRPRRADGPVSSNVNAPCAKSTATSWPR